MTDQVLIVGYGNSLRSDDGLGWHAAQRLVGDPRFAGTTILQRHQLTPELAYEVGTSAFVVFIDATTLLPPGEVRIERAQPLGSAGGTVSHHVNPFALVALSHQLYGRAAEVCVVGCGVQSLELGDRLSPTVQAAMPNVIDAVAALVASTAELRTTSAPLSLRHGASSSAGDDCT